MRALVADGSSHAGISFRDVPEPLPASGEVLIEVRAFSINRGEMRMLGSAVDGLRPGWDFAGVVASDEGGLRKGTRVVGIRKGGTWAERVAVRRDWIAELPDGVSFAHGAALPTAGLTALRTLRLGPAILGRRVLVTGASGGVVADLDGRFDLVLESVGGAVLARLVTMIDPRRDPGHVRQQLRGLDDVNARDVYNDALVRIQGFELFFGDEDFGRDLAYLARLVEEGKLDPQLADEMPWDEMPAALEL